MGKTVPTIVFGILIALVLVGMVYHWKGQGPAGGPGAPPGPGYPWLGNMDPANALSSRIAVPDGYQRIKAKNGSFGQWLQGLPLIKETRPPHTFNGTVAANNYATAAVVDLPIGVDDNMQAPFAILRLYAEYQFAKKSDQSITIPLTDGSSAEFRRWINGERLTIKDGKPAWEKKDVPNDNTHAALSAFLSATSPYVDGTSLVRSLKPVKAVTDLQIGDVFAFGPGNVAAVVVDMAKDQKTGKQYFALVQGGTPTQELYLVQYLASNGKMNVWFPLDFKDMYPPSTPLSPSGAATQTDNLIVPGHSYSAKDLYRF